MFLRGCSLFKNVFYEAYHRINHVSAWLLFAQRSRPSRPVFVYFVRVAFDRAVFGWGVRSC